MEASRSYPISRWNHWLKKGLFGILLVFASILVFSFSAFESGYLQNELALSKELQSSVSNMQEWKLSNESPFRYRILFKELVFIVHNNLFLGSNGGFYYSYIIVSYITFLATLIAFYYFLRINDFSFKHSLIGMTLFLLSPVTLMAYKIPVHLREDYLAYFILLLGLIAIYKNNLPLLITTFVLGPFCRETLLILPFTYLFFTNNQHYIKRTLISLIPFIVIILIRFFVGIDEYDYFLGLRWNIHNPIQVIVFSTITFHFMWVTLLVYFAKRNRLGLHINYLDRSILPVLLLVFVTTFVGGIFNEIRLLFLVFPWIIVMFLKTIKYQEIMDINLVFSRLKVQLLIISQVIIVSGLLIVLSKKELLMVSAYDVPYSQWIIVSFFCFNLMLVATLFYLPLLRSKPIT